MVRFITLSQRWLQCEVTSCSSDMPVPDALAARLRLITVRGDTRRELADLATQPPSFPYCVLVPVARQVSTGVSLLAWGGGEVLR